MCITRLCEQSEAIQPLLKQSGLPRRSAPRKDNSHLTQPALILRRALAPAFARVTVKGGSQFYLRPFLSLGGFARNVLLPAIAQARRNSIDRQMDPFSNPRIILTSAPLANQIDLERIQGIDIGHPHLHSVGKGWLIL
jgi:hypothetical protein